MAIRKGKDFVPGGTQKQFVERRTLRRLKEGTTFQGRAGTSVKAQPQQEPKTLVQAGQIPKESTKFKPNTGANKEIVAAGQIPAKKGVPITSQQASRIQAGTLKATPGTAAAAKAGTANIQDPTTGDIALSVGASIIGATQLTPGGRVTSLLGAGKSKTITSLLGTKGITVVGKLGDTTRGVVLNTKTEKIARTILGKSFTTAALIFGGAWAANVFLGLWGVAEGPEPLSIPISKFLIPNAMKTGDWTSVDEALASAEEITDLETWETIALGTPLSPLIGIPIKIIGARAGIEVLKVVSNDLRQEEPMDVMYARIRQEQMDDRIKVIETQIEAQKAYQIWKKDFEEFGIPPPDFEKQKKKEVKLIDDFYKARRRLVISIPQKTRLSNLSSLNFGLI